MCFINIYRSHEINNKELNMKKNENETQTCYEL